MHANVGDRLVVEGRTDSMHRREAEVLEVRGENGGPPYLVRWEDGHTSTMFPGPGALLKVVEEPHEPSEAAPAPSETGHLREWTVRVTIFERGDDTKATVALLADSTEALTARGTSHRGHDDPDDPRIGEEVAVARALRRLADQLLATAEHDIEVSTGEADVMVRAR